MLRIISSFTNAVSRRLYPPPFTFVVSRKEAHEPAERYKQGGFHPVRIGEVYKERYEVVRQLGWGMYSTVWLVQDIKDQRPAAMKVLLGNLMDEKSGWDERGMMQDIRDRNPQSLGYRHIVQLLDDFVIEGPNGNHITLVMEPMGATAFDFYRCLRGAMPLPIVKRISKHILLGLQYLHDECGMIHTDIKGENILMSGESFPTAPEAMKLTIDDVLARTFKLADIGSTNRAHNHFTKLIQPVALRAPEVILDAEWDCKADIWNFGCMMYEFARGAKLFDPFWNNEEFGLNPNETHLAQINGLLGQFSSRLLERCADASIYFDENGRLRKGGDRYGIHIVDLLCRAGHPQEDVLLTADFLLLTLSIDPEDRWTAAQLLQHPWLDGV